MAYFTPVEVSPSYGSIICFAPDTLLLTASG